MRLRQSFVTVLLGAVIALAGSASLAVLVPPTALADSSSSAIFADCNAHPGGLTGHYTVAQLRHALQVMPPETKEYTSCPDVVNRALLAAISVGRTGNGGSGGGSGSFLPTPVIVILVVLILVAVTFGAVAIRRRRGGGGGLGAGGDGLS
jgi:hypothetical protein